MKSSASEEESSAEESEGEEKETDDKKTEVKKKVMISINFVWRSRGDVI